MSVRKRKWTTAKGEEKEAWVVDYMAHDPKQGTHVRLLKTFARKKEADAFAASTKVGVADGTHLADTAKTAVKAAGEGWLKHCEARGLERATLAQYRQLVDLHILPFLGTRRLAELNVPAVRAFEDRLREEGRSAAMVRKIVVALGSLLADAQESGLVARNAVRDMRGSRRKGVERRQERRQKGRLKVGVDIPTRGEVKAIVGALDGYFRPLILTAIFTGLRASELRGLRWTDVDLDKREIHVRQRADCFNDIGKPKSEAGERSVPLPPLVLNTLREWKLSCPRRKTGDIKANGEPSRQLEFVFPNGEGNVEGHANIVKRGLHPAQVKAGVTLDTGKKDAEGNPIFAAKYTGLHSLRHFYASWCINRTQDGGLGLPPKVVQERMGHSTIVMTMDVYGHLFPRGDDGNELAAAESALLL